MSATVTLPVPRAVEDEPEGCARCFARVVEQVSRLAGVVSVAPSETADRLECTYEPDEITLSEIERQVARAVEANDARYVHQAVAIEGMDCADCARTLERGVARLVGVEHVSVHFAAARMDLEYDSATTDLGAVGRRVRELGYAISASSDAVETERGALWRLVRRRDNTLALISGALTLVGAVAALLDTAAWIPTLAWATAAAVGGAPLALKGLRSARATRSLNINLLMTIAVIGAAVLGDWFEAATVVFLFSLGEALEGYAMDRVRRSVRSLLTLAPPVATVRRGGLEATLPVARVVPGDMVVVRPGERVPLDGVVLNGISNVDQAALTGESLPVLKEPGDALFAGTLNGDGALTMRVTRLAADSSVARIIHQVEQAQAGRAPVQRVVDRFARVYTPAVIALAIGVAVVPALLGADPVEWARRSLVLLVIACPCALVLSTPISIVSALSAAAKRGILIKGGAALERTAAIDVVALDKTGTLTHGRPVVTGVWATDSRTPDNVLALAATLERHSEHPLGRALVAAALERELVLDEAHDTRALPGMGLVATIGGTEYRVGSRRLFDSSAVDVVNERSLAAIEAAGGTAALVGVQEHVYGVIGFADEDRDHAASAISALRLAGVERIVMLTGDREASARRVGQSVGVDQVVAGLLPEDKLAAVRDLRERGGVVAMVGDGINDAPSLAAADVGIAMGVAGSDAAIETADIALMGDDLRGVAQVIALGKRARRTIVTNIALSIGIKAVFLALAIAGAATLWMAILADMGTSLLVIALGLRLLRWRGE